MNILERLINVSLTDPCDAVRFTLLKSLKKEFFPFLALEGNLSRLMITVNDKSVKVRKVCVQILGQLVPFNSSFIMPSLTQLLSQHLSELNMQNRLKP